VFIIATADVVDTTRILPISAYYITRANTTSKQIAFYRGELVDGWAPMTGIRSPLDAGHNSGLDSSFGNNQGCFPIDLRQNQFNLYQVSWEKKEM
jgi:hypothetical protein